jgi:hypothetical protein
MRDREGKNALAGQGVARAYAVLLGWDLAEDGQRCVASQARDGA